MLMHSRMSEGQINLSRACAIDPAFSSLLWILIYYIQSSKSALDYLLYDCSNQHLGFLGSCSVRSKILSSYPYHYDTFGFSGRGLPCHFSSMQTSSSEQDRSGHEEQCTDVSSLPGIRSLAAGAAGGVCSVLVGHPFDLIKVRLQTADEAVRRSALDLLKSSLTRESRIRVRSSSRTAPSSFDGSRASMQASRLH